MTRRAHERAAAEAHLGPEHLHQRAAPHAALADHGDDARHPARHVVERLRQPRERLRATHEPLEVEPAHVARVRERGVVDSRVGLGAARGAHELVEVPAVLRRGGRAERERDPDRLVGDAAGEAVRAHGGEEPRRDRLRDEHRPVDHQQQLVARQRDRVGAAQATPHEHHELPQHHLDAPRIDLRAELDETRRHGGHHDDRPHRRDRARQHGQLGGGQMWCEIVGEHGGARASDTSRGGGSDADGTQP